MQYSLLFLICFFFLLLNHHPVICYSAKTYVVLIFYLDFICVKSLISPVARTVT